MSGSRGAIGALAAAGIVCGLAALALVLTGDHEQITGPFVVLALTLGWSFIGTGLYALWRRPGAADRPADDARSGSCGSSARCPESDSALVFTVGLALAGLWSGPFVHLLVAFPTGRVDAGLERALVRLGYAIPLLAPVGLLFLAQPSTDCPSCPENLLLVTDSPTAVDAVQIAARRSPASCMLAGVLRRARPALAALRARAAARAGAGRCGPARRSRSSASRRRDPAGARRRGRDRGRRTS